MLDARCVTVSNQAQVMVVVGPPVPPFERVQLEGARVEFDEVSIDTQTRTHTDFGRALIRELAAHGLGGELRVADRREELQDALRAARSDHTIVVVGGHATVGNVVDGAMRIPRSSRPRLAMIPGPTPHRVAEIAAAVARPHVRELDVGYLPDRDRYFAFTVGIGSPAHVRSALLSPEMYGPILGLTEELRDLVEEREIDVSLASERGVEHLRAHTLLICNASLNKLHAPVAAGDTSRLDVVAIQGKSAPHAHHALLDLPGNQPAGAVVTHYPVREASIATSEAMAVFVDGELAGLTPVTARIAPRAIRLCELPNGGEP